MKKIFIILYIFFAASTYAQIGNNWYFGDIVAFTFNTNATQIAPTLLSNSNLTCVEGCASISDSAGNLLFYSNGKKILNKAHQIMVNGDNLLGHPSAFQSVVAVQHPGNSNLYFVFCSDAFENNFNNGYTYNIIDMSKQNGLGEVVSKNNLLTNQSTERLTAIQHSNGNDIWIVTNDNYSNVFRSWLITCNGLQPTAVINSLGEVMNSFVEMNIGSMVASPNGKQICQTYFPDGGTLNFNHFFQLFDFDNNTGIMSNAKKIVLNRLSFGAAFSQNSKLLYLTDPNVQSFAQIETTLPTISAIQNSMVVIPCSYGFYGLQTAPNNKMYMARYGQYIVQINNPNTKGILCNYTDDSTKIILNGTNAINYPSFINNAFADENNDFNYQFIDSCTATIQFNAFSNVGSNVQYQWDFGDSTTATGVVVTHTYLVKNRQYNVRLKISAQNLCTPKYRAKVITPQGYLVNLNFEAMAKCDSAKVYFTNKSFTEPPTQNYIWSFGDGQSSTLKNPVHSYAVSGNYTVQLSLANANPCIVTPITKPVQFQNIVINAPNDFDVNEGNTIQILATSTGTNFSWSPNIYLNDSTLLTPTVTPLTTTTYIVKASNASNCISYDTITLNIIPKIEVYIPTVFTPNNDGVNDVIKPNFSATYKNINFKIFDKWGNIVFTGDTINNYTWNGIYKNKLAKDGTYVYLFSCKNNKDEPILKKGTIILLQ